MGQHGALPVTLATPHARAWIEARLGGDRSAGTLGAIGYERRPRLTSSPGVHGDPLPTPGPERFRPGDVAFAFLNFDLYARGWLRTPTYYELYWQPLLGHVPYAYWRLTQALYWSNSAADWTRRVRLDIQDTAAHLGVSRDLVRGKPAQGLGGALKSLDVHGLAAVERHAAGRATALYRPLSAAAAAADPVPGRGVDAQPQQGQHLDWLLAAGYDPQEWERELADLPTLLNLAAEEAPPEIEHYVNPHWESDELARTGYLRTPVYYDLFLQPLIGAVAYGIWRVCKCLNWASPAGPTPRTRSPRCMPCRRSSTATGKRSPAPAAAGRGWPIGRRARSTVCGPERLALIREEGEGSQVAYRLLVVNEPPLLCPEPGGRAARPAGPGRTPTGCARRNCNWKSGSSCPWSRCWRWWTSTCPETTLDNGSLARCRTAMANKSYSWTST